MDNLEYIDSFFNNELSPDERSRFDRRIGEEPEFAEQVAFYISTREIAKEQTAKETKERFREIYSSQAPVKQLPFIRRAAPYLAAACLIIVALFSWFMNNKQYRGDDLAQAYMQENLEILGVNMSDQTDSIQAGLKLYNDKQYAKSGAVFEKMLKSNPTNAEARKYAGLAALYNEAYDKAIGHFRELADQKGLFANPGKFYQAITLMRRNIAGDSERASILLRQVVSENLQGKETAEEWLKQL